MNLKNNIYTHIMLNGNKQTSEKLFLKIAKKLQKVENKKKFDDILKNGIINSSPVIFLKQIKRKRKQTSEFPFLLISKSRISYGLKFIVKNCRKLNIDPFYKNFKTELLNSSRLLSQSFKTKISLHKESFLKKKFANYRWF